MARHIGHYCSLTFSCTAALEFRLCRCAFFVDPYQAAGACDIRRQNSRQSPLCLLAAQGGPPGFGEIDCSYSTIVGRCPAMPTPELSHSRPGRAGDRSGHVRCASKAEAVTQYQQLRDKPFKLRNGSLEIFWFSEDPNQFYICRRPVPQRGVSRTSQTRSGMRWTRAVLLTRAWTADGEDVWS